MAQGLLAHDAPRTMLEHCGRPGRTWCFRVTGDVEGPVWGSDTYTGDSSIAAAAVHAGVAQPGEATVVRIVVVEPPDELTPEGKAGWYNSIRTVVQLGIAKGYDPDNMLVMLAFEAWVASAPLADAENLLPPSMSDNRREMLVVLTEKNGGKHLVTAFPIGRGDDGVWLGAADPMFGGDKINSLSGAGVGFFP
jgi:hypothetical protein